MDGTRFFSARRVCFSWLDFYPAKQHGGEAPSSTRDHRAAPRHMEGRQRNSLRAASGAGVARCSGLVSEPQLLVKNNPPARALGDALWDKSETKPQDEGACGLEPDSECVICMDYEAAYAWEDCDHFRPLLCSGCVRLSSNAGIQTSCVMFRRVSKLAAYFSVSTPS